MKFFRWILSNIIMIVIVVGLIYSYVYWGNLAGSDTPAGKAIVYLSDEFVEVKEFVDGIKAKNEDKEGQNKQEDALVSIASKGTVVVSNSVNTDVNANDTSTTAPTVPAINETVASASLPTAAEKSSVAANEEGGSSHNAAAVAEVAVPASSNSLENAEKWQPVQQPVTITYSHNQTQVQQDSSGEVHVQEQNVQTTVASDIVQIETQKDGFVTPAIEKELETATADGGVAALTPDATRSVWIDARKAFYQHDFAESEKRYKRVISMTKDNYDAYGELGNVYFHQGKNSEAADAYMEASVILLRLGQTNRAHSLLGLMRYLDKEKALLLQQRLEQEK